MQHTITVIHHVEADTWDQAVMEVARAPLQHAVICRVKTPGSRMLHVMPSQIQAALEIDAKLEPQP